MKPIRSVSASAHVALYVLVTLAGLGLYFAAPPPATHSELEFAGETLVADQFYPVGEDALLRYGPATRLFFPDEKTLRIAGEDVAFTEAEGGRIQVAKENSATNYLFAALSLALDGSETQALRQKLGAFSRKHLPDSLRGGGQSAVAEFVRALRQVESKGQHTFILNGELLTGKLAETRLSPPVWVRTGIRMPAQSAAPAARRPWQAALVALAGLAGLAITALGRKPIPVPNGRAVQFPSPAPVPQPDPRPVPPAAPDEPGDPVSTHPDPKAVFIETYAARFLARYGVFFDELQRIPVLPDEAEARRARQRLVEMGLHAHALARTVYLNHLTPETAEPNVLLVLNDWRVTQLDPARYRPLTPDPYQTEKRYRMLLPILQDLDLGSLDGALLDDVAVSETQLKPFAR